MENTETKSDVYLSFMKNHDIILGTVSGSLIQLNSALKSKHDFYRNVENTDVITSMCWKANTRNMLLYYKNGDVFEFDDDSKKFNSVLKNVKQKIIQLVPFHNDFMAISERDGVYLYENNSLKKYIAHQKSEIQVKKATQSPYADNFLAVGGVNNDLTIYDLNSKKIHFNAKQDKHDNLNLRKPVTTCGIEFLGPDLLVTVTSQGYVKVFDPRVQRRATLSFSHPKNTPCYNCLSATSDPQRVIVGTNKGAVQIFDIRKTIQPLKARKLCISSLVDIAGSETDNVVLTCTMDRYFRMIDNDSLSSYYENYLKIRPTYLMARTKYSNGKASESHSTDEDIEEEEEEDMEEEENDEDMEEEGESDV